MAKKLPKSISLTAADIRKPRDAIVEHPSGYLGVDRVKKVEETIDAMHHRKQLTDKQYATACHYRTSFDIVAGQMGQTLDTDRIRGGGASNMGPSEHILQAAEVLNRASKLLGSLDSGLVEMIAGRGYSIDDCAARIGSRKADAPVDKEDRLDCGRRFRMALDILGGREIKIREPDANDRPSIRSFREAKHSATDDDVVLPSRVAHASHGKIDWTGG